MRTEGIFRYIQNIIGCIGRPDFMKILIKQILPNGDLLQLQLIELKNNEKKEKNEIKQINIKKIKKK